MGEAQAEVEREPAFAVPQADAGDFFDPAQAVVDAGPMQTQLVRRALDGAGAVEEALEGRDQRRRFSMLEEPGQLRQQVGRGQALDREAREHPVDPELRPTDRPAEARDELTDPDRVPRLLIGDDRLRRRLLEIADPDQGAPPLARAFPVGDRRGQVLAEFGGDLDHVPRERRFRRDDDEDAVVGPCQIEAVARR